MNRAAAAAFLVVALGGATYLASGRVGKAAVDDAHPVQPRSRQIGSPTFHSATHRYSVRQVQQAFAAQGLELRNVLPQDFRGLLALLTEPSHAVYVYVIQAGCKCAFLPPIRNGRKTRHGNLDVLWIRSKTAAVRAALRTLE
jgi:hypothetical protein